MTHRQKIGSRLSKVRQRLNEIAGLDDLDNEVRAEAHHVVENTPPPQPL